MAVLETIGTAMMLLSGVVLGVAVDNRSTSLAHDACVLGLWLLAFGLFVGGLVVLLYAAA